MPEPTDTASGERGNWRTRALDWLFSQGVSTVLLVMILIGGIVEAPRFLEEIKTSYQEIDAAHTVSIEKMHAIHDAQIKSLAETFKEERKLEREQSREAVGAIRELSAEFRAARTTNKTPN